MKSIHFYILLYRHRLLLLLALPLALLLHRRRCFQPFSNLISFIELRAIYDRLSEIIKSSNIINFASQRLANVDFYSESCKYLSFVFIYVLYDLFIMYFVDEHPINIIGSHSTSYQVWKIYQQHAGMTFAFLNHYHMHDRKLWSEMRMFQVFCFEHCFFNGLSFDLFFTYLMSCITSGLSFQFQQFFPYM